MSTLKENLLLLNVYEDNEYLDKYVDIIEQNRETKQTAFKTQRHHIVPKSYFKSKQIAVDDSKENLVNLNHADHLLAHYFLFKCSVDSNQSYSNCYAVMYMLNTHKVPDTEEEVVQSAINYGELYTAFCMRQSERVKSQPNKPTGKKPSEETRKKLSISHTGLKQSEETREKHRRLLKEQWATGVRNRTVPEEQRRKISKSASNKATVHMGDVQKLIPLEELDTYLAAGWVRGFTEKNRARIISSNPILQKGRTFSEETRRRMSKPKQKRKLPKDR